MRTICCAVLNNLQGPEFPLSTCRYLIDKGILCCSGPPEPVTYMWNRQHPSTWTAPSFCIPRCGSEHILTSLGWADRKLSIFYTSLHSTVPSVYLKSTLYGPLFAAGRTIH
jgi:hypothetical protein